MAISRRGRAPAPKGLEVGPSGEMNPKARQILDAARAIFLREGYDTTNMDRVAREADVSKATVYAHYQSKEALLLAVVERELQAIPPQNLWESTGAPFDTEAELLAIARRYAAYFQHNQGMDFRQLVMAQSHRVPAVGRLFWEHGPRRARMAMRRFFEQAVAQGDMVIPDLDVAATQFLNLVRGDWPLERDIYQKDLDMDEVNAYVTGAVRMILAVYGVHWV